MPTSLKKTKITYIIVVLFLPFIVYGQNLKSELETELRKIDSIVALTNSSEKNYSEGIAEGLIKYKSIFRKKGGWEAYYLYENPDENPPLRIKYNEAGYKTYEQFEFHYKNGNLIYAKLNVDFYRGKRKNKPIEKRYYFKNSQLFSDSNSELEKYNEEYIIRTEKYVREMIYE